MKLTLPRSFFVLSLVSTLISAHPPVDVLRARRTSSMLIRPPAQPNLPTAEEAAAAASAASLDLDNIQGDVLIGMKKTVEFFYFFNIKEAREFKARLKTIRYYITTTRQLLDVDSQPAVSVNIAFTHTGLTALNVTDDLRDPAFAGGQFSDATNLGDPGTCNWVPQLASNKIHGVILLASDNWDNIWFQLSKIRSKLGPSAIEIYRLGGNVRPGEFHGHEHFGYMDGISQPAVKGFTASPNPGQKVVDPGAILLGETGDPISRPAWAKDGTFMAFRQIQQLVPEFNQFLADNPISLPGLTREQGSELLGARMIGRWKSGAPIDLSPFKDDPALGADPMRNNNFTFAHAGEDIQLNQTRCPYSAHIRKTRPRADLPSNNISIMRAGIPYGPEVTHEEARSHYSKHERGLAFVSYQSNLDRGFRFIQRNWANNQFFAFHTSDPSPGVDPIIGVQPGSKQRAITGLNPGNQTGVTLVTEFVVSRGGEYFFVPSLSAISNTLAA